MLIFFKTRDKKLLFFCFLKLSYNMLLFQCFLDFCFLSFQQAWLWCLCTIPQAFDGLGMTKAHTPSPGAVCEDSSYSVALHADQSLYQIQVTCHVCNLQYKNTVPINIVPLCDLERRTRVSTLLLNSSVHKTSKSVP